MRLHHGAHTEYVLHVGQCYTDDERSAEIYANGGSVATIEIDLSDLIVVEVEDYDHDDNMAPGDDGKTRGADVLIYQDEDERGRTHTTYRLMTRAAVATARIA